MQLDAEESSEESSGNQGTLEIQEKTDAQVKAEKDAIAQVTKATLQGIKKGERASRKLHQDAKTQSEEETTLQISKLKEKYDSTKKKVKAIVSNFSTIHKDLVELKREYLQEKS